MVESIQQTLLDAARTLSPLYDTARLDAEVLLAWVLQVNRSYLYAWPERKLDAVQASRFEQLLLSRLDGRPIAYLTGRREFRGLPLAVNEHTLIPRPETEGLVDLVLERVAPDARSSIVDLGTGSGAIALCLARERPDCAVLATDNSRAALAMARHNAAQLGLTNLDFLESDWCASLQGCYDVMVSNPPYVAADDPHLRQGDLRFEPASALQSGVLGMDAIQHLGHCAPDHLNPGGWLLLEHGIEQAERVRECLRYNGFAELATLQDLSGRDRYSIGRLPG